MALIAGGLDMGGSTTFLINLAGELVRRSIPVKVFSMELKNPMHADFEQRRIPLLCLDQRRKIFEDRMEALLQELASFCPTTVVSTLGATSFEPLRYLPSGVFRVGMGQSDDPQVYEMMAHYAKHMDWCAMVSQAMQEKAAAMPAFCGVPVSYLPLGVPMCAESELPRRDFQRPLRLLYLGRLDRVQKRVHLFPAILQGLKDSGIPFSWTIAGSGPEKDSLENSLRTERSDQSVRFLGHVRYDQVPGLLQEHDVFLLASDFEGLPLSLLEAMGCGLVPVVTDLPSGIPEVVNDENGCLVGLNDTGGYARAIVQLHQDRQVMAAKSVAARERVAGEFSVAAMTNRWLKLFPAAAPSVVWPKRWQIKAPLPARDKWRYSPPMRWARRFARIRLS